MTKPPLAFEDAFELLGPALPGGAIVLVGGQALIHWLTYYRDRVEALRQLSFVTSDDVDFYGTQEDARRMAEAIAGSDVRNFGVDSLSAATAIVRFRDQAGEERQVDFLRTIHGLDTEQVRNTAIEVELKNRAGNPTGVSLRIHEGFQLTRVGVIELVHGVAQRPVGRSVAERNVGQRYGSVWPGIAFRRPYAVPPGRRPPPRRDRPARAGARH